MTWQCERCGELVAYGHDFAHKTDCPRATSHPLKVAMDEIAMRERFGTLYDEIFGHQQLKEPT